ncbi:protein-tyrosine-phosphatase [Streptomyces spiroverticillatus]|nr:protein-tyrosine-phosphatase [Streptomyces spiroverticillatus]
MSDMGDMGERNRWIPLEGAVNARDLGGLPTADGRVTRAHRLYRSDNLQSLTAHDVDHLTRERNLRQVVDLRSDTEAELDGPGPLVGHPLVTHHHLSLLYLVAEPEDLSDAVPVDNSEGARSIALYRGYLSHRADSVLSALRVIAHGEGASIVNCAAGKDRTGVVIALALSVVGVTREAIVADYAATGERVAALLARLRASPTYAKDLGDDLPESAYLPRPFILESFLAGLDEQHEGPLGWLRAHGWTAADTEALRARML